MGELLEYSATQSGSYYSKYYRLTQQKQTNRTKAKVRECLKHSAMQTCCHHFSCYRKGRDKGEESITNSKTEDHTRWEGVLSMNYIHYSSVKTKKKKNSTHRRAHRMGG